MCRLTGMMRTWPPPGTGLESVEQTWPFGKVTYVSVPIEAIRCFVTFGLDRQNQHSSAVRSTRARRKRVDQLHAALYELR